MNTLLDVRVNMHLDSTQRPEVIGLFDEIKTDHLVYAVRGRKKEDPLFGSLGSILTKTVELMGYNLLATDNDLASYFFYSAANSHGPHTKTLAIEGLAETVAFEGLWSSNADATNLWYPETLVMDARITSDRNEFLESIPPPGGMVARNVILMLKERNWRVGVVKGSDGYTNVEPLLPDGTPKNERWGARVLKIF